MVVSVEGHFLLQHFLDLEMNALKRWQDMRKTRYIDMKASSRHLVSQFFGHVKEYVSNPALWWT